MNNRARWISAALAVVLLAAVVGLAWPLPASWTAPEEHRRVVDRSGAVLLERRVPDRGRALWVELDEVAPVVVDALLASEDDRFHRHWGVDPRAVIRATRANLRAGHVVQGGSTLTQQAARLVAPRPPGWRGKLVEAGRALRLETHLAKDQILVQVLNRAWFGAGAAGIEAAAQEIFGEHASGLSPSEAATLVGLLPAPERLDPRRNRKGALEARNRVLDRMVGTGRLSEEDAVLARDEPLQLRRPTRPGRAPHLATRLLAERDDTVIHTTLDADLQQEVEDLVQRHIGPLKARDVDHGAVVVIHVPTAEVRAWVGSADWSAEDGQNDGVLARRSPGSTLKPFVYALGFEQDLRPGDVVPDLPVRYRTPHGSWSPGNYAGSTRGPVRAREALGSSLNLPAVAVLDRVGVQTLHRRLDQAGIALTAPAHTYGLGLALGDAEITLLDLTNAYAGLARGGVFRPARLHPDDPRPEGRRFLDPVAATLVRDVLADPLARVAAFGRHGPLERRYDAAVKTGTSQGYRDNWTVGWAGDWVVGVWAGNFDARPMGDVSGVTGAAPLWGAVMDHLVAEERPRFAHPEGWEVHRICALSGMSAGPECSATVDERLPPRWPARATCDWHRDGELVWPAEYAEWAHAHGQDPWEAEARGEGRAAITWPDDGAELYLDPRLPRAVSFSATAPVGTEQAEWRVDGEALAVVGPPFAYTWRDPPRGPHLVELFVDGRAADRVRLELR